MQEYGFSLTRTLSYKARSVDSVPIPDNTGQWKPVFSHILGCNPFSPLRNMFLCTLTHYSPVLLFYTPWKHQKTFRFSDVFRGCRKATAGCNSLTHFIVVVDFYIYHLQMLQKLRFSNVFWEGQYRNVTLAWNEL